MLGFSLAFVHYKDQYGILLRTWDGDIYIFFEHELWKQQFKRSIKKNGTHGLSFMYVGGWSERFFFGESIQNTSLFAIVHTNFEFWISYNGTSSMSVMLALNHYEVSLRLEFQFTIEAVVLHEWIGCECNEIQFMLLHCYTCNITLVILMKTNIRKRADFIFHYDWNFEVSE